jgi:sterol desaturase/sphingolipid hydroxylase (fatty acid hydroxylase superfamily)
MGITEWVFFASLPVVIFLEHRHPRRRYQGGLARDNVVSAVFLLVKAAAGAAAAALYLVARGHVTSPVAVAAALPFALQCVVALAVIDLKQYWIHRAQHRFQWYYEFHKVHHAAPRLNWLALGRTHPFDYFFLQQVTDLVVVFVLGLSFEAYLVGHRLPSALIAGLWSHMNFDYPALDRPLPWFARVVATPNIHAEHHRLSADQPSNFGEVFVAWDGLFGTFAAPRTTPLAFGIEPGQLPDDLWGQLAVPVRRLVSADG